MSDRAIRRALEEADLLLPVPPSFEVFREEVMRLLRREEVRPIRVRDLNDLRAALERA